MPQQFKSFPWQQRHAQTQTHTQQAHIHTHSRQTHTHTLTMPQNGAAVNKVGSAAQRGVCVTRAATGFYRETEREGEEDSARCKKKDSCRDAGREKERHRDRDRESQTG